ncbi:cilia- and flagella-associated protein 298-like [Oscarella lobularis]|uniref:cilia- and flagella-associated protein 298-like n=1 Tax=Oscarella lobularis TaxID=121494 RepID=UPI0033142F97
MVVLHVKKGNESQFLYETTTKVPIGELVSKLVSLYNGRLKISRICSEMEAVAEHGLALPANMQGLTDEQIEELHLVDEWATRCEPSGGHRFAKDPMGCRNGRAPSEKMVDLIKRTVSEAKTAVSHKQIEAGVFVTETTVKDALDKLRGVMMIIYPMGLPPHEPIRMEFEGNEDLSGTQAALAVLDEANSQLWWAGKELALGKKLEDFVGKNEKTKIVAKLQKKGLGAPAREPIVSEEEQKRMMAYAYRRQEELKKLDEDSSSSYLNAQWADPLALKKAFTGTGNVSWRPK